MAYMYEEEEYPDERARHILEEKMKKWGIVKDEKTNPFIHTLWTDIFSRAALAKLRHARVPDVYAELISLKKRVRNLEKRVGGKRKLTEVDFAIESNREELEKKYFGKIVAIDIDSLGVVGIGDTILEAYNNAKEQTGKDKFDFRRIGYKYIYRV